MLLHVSPELALISSTCCLKSRLHSKFQRVMWWTCKYTLQNTSHVAKFPTPFLWARCHFNDAYLCSDWSWVVIWQLPPKTHQRTEVKEEKYPSALLSWGSPHSDTRNSGLALIHSLICSVNIAKTYQTPLALERLSPFKTAVISTSPNLTGPRDVVQNVSP